MGLAGVALTYLCMAQQLQRGFRFGRGGAGWPGWSSGLDGTGVNQQATSSTNRLCYLLRPSTGMHTATTSKSTTSADACSSPASCWGRPTG